MSSGGTSTDKTFKQTSTVTTIYSIDKLEFSILHTNKTNKMHKSKIEKLFYICLISGIAAVTFEQ